MKLLLLTSIMLILCVSFRTDKVHAGEQKSAIELLAGKHWKLISFGYDANGNGQVDECENEITECQVDDSYLFNKNGTVRFFDNKQYCGGLRENEFNWRLLENEKILDLYFAFINIDRLNENELLVSTQQLDSNGHIIRYLTLYRH